MSGRVTRMSSLALLAALLGSNVLTALITVWFNRRKTRAETNNEVVQTALALEQRAHERYQSTAAALDEAEKLLSYARKQLQEQAVYILQLQEVLEASGIEVPPEPCSN